MASGIVWPFPTFNKSQFRRTDEGQDLQYPGTNPVPIRAIASGTIVQLGPDPGGFGTAYPGETLDSPISGFSEIYYGHVFLDPGIVGQHVQAGQVIAHTGGLHSGGDAFSDPNWLELGFWPPSWSHGPAMHALLTGGNVSTTAATTTAFNPLNPGSWITSLFAPFGGDIKTITERLGLILLGGILILVGIWMIGGKKTVDLVFPKSGGNGGAAEDEKLERKLGEPRENPGLEVGKGAVRETKRGTERRKMTAQEYANPDTSGAEMDEVPF